MNDWNDWNGVNTIPPVPPDTRVEVRFVSGERATGRADEFVWGLSGRAGAIVAYRTPSQDLASVTAELNGLKMTKRADEEWHQEEMRRLTCENTELTQEVGELKHALLLQQTFVTLAELLQAKAMSAAATSDEQYRLLMHAIAVGRSHGKLPETIQDDLRVWGRK